MGTIRFRTTAACYTDAVAIVRESSLEQHTSALRKEPDRYSRRHRNGREHGFRPTVRAENGVAAAVHNTDDNRDD